MALNSFQVPQKKSSLPMILIIGGIVLVVLGGAYWYFKIRENPVPSDTVESDTLTPSTAATSSISPEDQAKVDAITGAVATLKTLNLDIKFFEDPRFTSLKETEVVIPDIAPREKHPFKFIDSASPAPDTVPPGKKK